MNHLYNAREFCKHMQTIYGNYYNTINNDVNMIYNANISKQIDTQPYTQALRMLKKKDLDQFFVFFKSSLRRNGLVTDISNGVTNIENDLISDITLQILLLAHIQYYFLM
jgi:hypothetical protein